ncbi:ABC-2 type transport system permease protein [Streptomyces misionensis]|uniref:Transport permease protein n=1 Tax=Streptomyces misionensis TaxID=67331 RepID=A0A1H4IA75_9ACTN|nr:ABC transporter permease [Streptomyces misionensis]SEB30901.1 ABC-2 type transport system permease protein [Streptomyces misionensis]
MTTTTIVSPPRAGRLSTGWHTFAALLSRDLRVTRRQLGSLALRAVMQPLAFTFGFAYVLPKIGLAGGFGGQHPGAPRFTTVLVPGLVAITIAVQGITAVMIPLLMELTYTKQMEDRALAPVPMWVIAVQKIVSAAIQALLAGLVVFPVVLLVHAPGQAPDVHVHNWPLFATALLLASLLAACTGLLLGTVFDVQKVQHLFAAVITPLTVLGCVYFPWSELRAVPWLQYVTLANPVVYMGEGLRAALTPGVGHMPVWAVLLAQTGGIVLFGGLALRNFRRRVTG